MVLLGQLPNQTAKAPSAANSLPPSQRVIFALPQTKGLRGGCTFGQSRGCAHATKDSGADHGGPAPHATPDVRNGTAGPSKPADDLVPRKVLTSKVPKPSIRNSSLSGSVKNATARYDLPSPALAVRNLVEQAKIAHLCTLMSNMHHRRAGYPFGTLVDFASDGSGFPIFCLSPLAIHTRNILEDSRCSLVVELPGWTGLANARATIFGDVYQLSPDLQVPAKEIFNRKQAAERKEGWVMGNYMFFRMHRISDIYFVGGFGTVQWVDVGEYAATTPDNIVLDEPHRTLQTLNDHHAEALKKLLSRNSQPAEDAAFISIDRLGTDVRVRHGNEYSVERLGFDFHVNSLDDALSATSQLLNHGIPPNLFRRVAAGAS